MGGMIAICGSIILVISLMAIASPLQTSSMLLTSTNSTQVVSGNTTTISTANHYTQINNPIPDSSNYNIIILIMFMFLGIAMILTGIFLPSQKGSVV